MFTAPRHPQSNELAENFVKTFKSAINAMNPTTLDDLEQKVDYFLLHYRNAVHCSTSEPTAVLLKGRHLKSNVVGLPAAEVMFSRGNERRMANGIVIRTHGHNMVDIIDLEDGSSHRRHIDQVRFRTDIRQEKAESPKLEQLERIELKTPQPTVKDNAEHTQDPNESNNDSNLGQEENEVDEATKSNDESEERLEPPPITSPVRRRRYRPSESVVPWRSERIRERNKHVNILNQRGL